MTIQYKNPIPVAVCLVRVKSLDSTLRLLAVRRGIQPAKGGLAFPGGYVDEGESAEMAATREMLEETGLTFPLDTWSPVATRVTAENRLLVFLEADLVLQESDLEGFVPNREVTELAVVNETDMLAFPLHDQLLKSLCWK